jgi:hypothetical protein
MECGYVSSVRDTKMARLLLFEGWGQQVLTVAEWFVGTFATAAQCNAVAKLIRGASRAFDGDTAAYP